MITKFHRRRVTAFTIVFVVLTVIMLILLVKLEEPKEDWGNLLGVGLVQIFFGVGALLERNKLKEIRTIDIPQSNSGMLDAAELIVKRNVSLLDEYWLFNPHGEYLGIIRPRVPWFVYPFGLLLRGEQGVAAFFGLDYCIMDAGDRLIGHFQLGKGLKTVVNIFDAGDRLIGIYRQDDWKSLKSVFNLHGELFTSDNQKILDAKVSGFSGNFKLTDINGKHWASLSSGQFPLEYRKVFKDKVNPLVKLNPDLTHQERILLLAMVTCWFLQVRRV